MKKFADLLKANILIFFGALLFLLFLNYLSGQGAAIAVGVYAIIISVYYLTIGILGIFIGAKFNAITKKVFDVVSVCLFTTFMFSFFLISLINSAQINGYMGPTAWIIAIFSILAALAITVFYPIGKFVKNNAMKNMAALFSAIFCLALLLEILFTGSGAPVALGNIQIMYLAVFLLFGIYLFGTLKEEEPARLPAPKAEEEPAPEEEAPVEEAEAQPEEAKEE